MAKAWYVVFVTLTMYSIMVDRFRMEANSGTFPEEAQGPIAGSLTSWYVLPSVPRAIVPVVVLVMEFPPARASFRVTVNVAWNGFPVTVLPPKLPLRPPNSNMPAIGPPGPGPRPPKPPGPGGPCALTTIATPASNNVPIPTPTIAFLTTLSSKLILQVLRPPASFYQICLLLNQLDPARPAILTHQ